VRPLEAAKSALDGHASFVRDNALLVIMTIAASDDASAGAAADYAAGMQARKSDPLLAYAMGFYNKPASRLDAFHAALTNRNDTTDIDSADLAAALAQLGYLYRTSLPSPCAREPADVDAVTAGPQYDCDLSAYYEDDTVEAIRQCTEASTAGCFEFVTDALECADLKRFRVRGSIGRYMPTVRGQCVVTD
jgi:hypothetical protein